MEGAQELAAPGAATRFEIHLPGDQGAAFEEAIQGAKARLVAALGPDVSVESWREAAPDLAAILDLMDPVMMVFAFFIFVLAGLLVVNTIYLSLVERIREFGVIIAVGADRRRVMRMVFAESLVLVLTGSVTGLIVAGSLVAWFSGGLHHAGDGRGHGRAWHADCALPRSHAGASGDHDDLYNSYRPAGRALAGSGGRPLAARRGHEARCLKCGEHLDVELRI